MKPNISIYNHATGEHIHREMTDEEFAQYEIDCAKVEMQKEQQKLELEQLRQTKIEAYKKLGLSAEEIEAILPTPKPAVIL